jgi:hypothetical protein
LGQSKRLSGASGLELSGGEYNVDHLKLYLTSGQQTLLIIIDGEQKIHGAISNRDNQLSE